MCAECNMEQGGSMPGVSRKPRPEAAASPYVGGSSCKQGLHLPHALWPLPRTASDQDYDQNARLAGYKRGRSTRSHPSSMKRHGQTSTVPRASQKLGRTSSSSKTGGTTLAHLASPSMRLRAAKTPPHRVRCSSCSATSPHTSLDDHHAQAAWRSTANALADVLGQGPRH